MELTLYISTYFNILSHFSQFHPLLSQNQVGAATMKIVDYHIKRHDLRRSELNEIANTPQYEQEIKKFEILNKKQSKLLYSNS